MMSSRRLLRTLALAIAGAIGLGLQSPGAAALLPGQQPKPAEVRPENTQASAGIASACEKGDALSCRNLAVMYANGRGVPKDDARAATFWERACDLRDMPSCNSLGFAYEAGRGVTKDDARAVALYQRTCEGNITVGCVNLGRMYEMGRGVPKDESKALAFYETVCTDRLTNGCNNLGALYEYGRGVDKDEARAATFYAQACEGPTSFGCANLGRLYENGRGVAKDVARAAQLYQRSCDANFLNGCVSLGLMYAAGRGVAKDDARAMTLYQKACDGGDVVGCRNLSSMYASGRTPARNAVPPVAAGAPGMTPGRSSTAAAPPPARPTATISSGTAFVVSASGLMLTAHHVVDGATEISVKCPGAAVRVATVATKAPLVDLVLLQASGTTPFKDYLALGTNWNGGIGARVFTVGYPAPGLLGADPKYTEGTVSAMAGPKGDASFLQISVPIQPGNSGGALIDEGGSVVGIVVSAAAPAAFLKDTGTLPQNINWAVKSAYAAPLFSDRKVLGSGTSKPSRDRSAVIAKATAASCLVVASKPTLAPVPTTPPPSGTGRGGSGGGPGGVVGGVAGGIVGGLGPAPPPPPPPPPPAGPVRIGGNIHQPAKLKDARPVYPTIAQAARVQGVVVLEATIAPNGQVSEAKVLRSIPLLDQAALDAVRQWQFTPTLLNGVAVPVIMTVSVNFSLQADRTTFEKACSAGDLAKCRSLAGMIRSGSGGAKDPLKAAELFKRGCDGGDAVACYSLGQMYQRDEVAGSDLSAAGALHKKACDANDVGGCAALAWMTSMGRGVPKSAPQATALYDQAIALGETACRNHEPRGCAYLVYLGITHQSGDGARTDLRKAVQLYQTACDSGSQAGCAMLGVQYEAGPQVPNTSITKDLSRAATLYERACPAAAVPSESDDPAIATIVASGRAQACGNLGSFYEHGTAVAQDPTRALTFYQRACDAQQTKGVELPKLQNRCDDLSRLRQPR